VHNWFPAKGANHQLVVSRASIAEAEMPTREEYDGFFFLAADDAHALLLLHVDLVPY